YICPFFFFQAEDAIRGGHVTGVQTCALPISLQRVPARCRPPARYGSVQAGGIEPARAEAIAQALMAAENPVAFAAYLGRKPQARSEERRVGKEFIVRLGGVDVKIVILCYYV